MKKIILGVLALVFVASLGYAGGGKGIVPMTHYYKSSSTRLWGTNLFITNLTDHPVKVIAKFYDKNGALVPASWLSYGNFINLNTEIAAKSTAQIEMSPSTNIAWGYGFAVIEWSNTVGYDDSIALIAHGYVFYNYDAMFDTRIGVPVNNGLPF